ncbi:MAG: ABC transporter substrate-binding protein [Hyphomicrobiales bacterium]
MGRRWTSWVAAGLFLAASAQGAVAATLRAVMHSDINVLDPVWSSAYITRDYGYLVYDVLFALDAKLQPQPQMVDSWTVSEDKLTYRFTLRDGLEWHDGNPVTSEDCLASIKRWGARDTMGQKLMGFISELKADDAKTFEIVLKEPYGLVIDSLAKPSGLVPFMMPKRVAETDPYKQISDYTGSGPFMLKRDEWRPGDRIVFVRNPNYKPRPEPPSGLAGGKVAKLDRIEWIVMPDAQTQVNALVKDEIDMVETVGLDLLPLLERNASVSLATGSYGYQYVFRPNWLQPPFDNEKVRQAAQLALRQDDVLAAAVGDPRYYRTCKALFPCGTPYASTVGTDGRIEGDWQKAKALLREAGYDGTPVTLLQPTDVAVLANLAPVAKSLLEKAGFKVDLQPLDWQSLVSRVYSNKGPPSAGGWNAFLTSFSVVDILDPLTTSYLAANCAAARAGWPCDAAMEQLRDRFARETDPAKRKEIAEEVQLRYMQVVTHVHLGEWFTVSAFRTTVDRSDWPALPPVMVFWNLSKKGG